MVVVHPSLSKDTDTRRVIAFGEERIGDILPVEVRPKTQLLPGNYVVSILQKEDRK